jgi:hypothetical protein
MSRQQIEYLADSTGRGNTVQLNIAPDYVLGWSPANGIRKLFWIGRIVSHCKCRVLRHLPSNCKCAQYHEPCVRDATTSNAQEQQRDDGDDMLVVASIVDGGGGGGGGGVFCGVKWRSLSRRRYGGTAGATKHTHPRTAPVSTCTAHAQRHESKESLYRRCCCYWRGSRRAPASAPRVDLAGPLLRPRRHCHLRCWRDEKNSSLLRCLEHTNLCPVAKNVTLTVSESCSN